MILKNKLGKSFGQGGSSTGIFLFIGGVIMTYFSLIGLILVFLGSFIGFTFNCAIIDTSKMRCRAVTNLFGIIKVGKWKDIKHGMKLVLKKSNKGFGTHTRGHSRDFYIKDIRIILLDENNTEIMELEKFSTIDLAKIGLEKLNNLLNLQINNH